MEIHRTRGAPLKDYIPDEQKDIFRVRMLPLRYVGFCKKIDEASKKNNFQKKFIEKYLFFEEIGRFQEQTSATVSKNPGNFQ